MQLTEHEVARPQRATKTGRLPAGAEDSAIFFVSNNHDGTLRIQDSVITGNTGGEWNVLPGISMHEDTEQVMTNATIE